MRKFLRRCNTESRVTMEGRRGGKENEWERLIKRARGFHFSPRPTHMHPQPGLQLNFVSLLLIDDFER